ncbi:MAG: stage II sporulation protein M, partial [Erysipelotrichaceae bacterium]|nr:stage II sporulation protein M [Erysipelotrichaceae bacterium]
MKRKRLYRGFIRKYKNVYLFILILVAAGFCMGIFLSNYIDMNDTTHLSNYLTTVNEGVDKYAYFVNQFFLGILFVIFVFLLGTSIVGIPIVSFIAFTKGIQIGFSCALFVYTYQLKGIIGIVLTLLPQVLFDLLATFLISACAIQLSMYIIYSCTNREKLDLKKLCNSVLNDIFISFIFVLIASYVKATVVI